MIILVDKLKRKDKHTILNNYKICFKLHVQMGKILMTIQQNKHSAIVQVEMTVEAILNMRGRRVLILNEAMVVDLAINQTIKNLKSKIKTKIQIQVQVNKYNIHKRVI